MLVYSEILKGKVIIENGEPHEVLDGHVFQMQKTRPVNQTKLKNLITGKIFDRAFHQSEKAMEAELETNKIKYLYNNRGEYWFCEESDPSERFKLEQELMGNGSKYIKQNSLVDALVFEEKIISLKLPIKMDLKVTEAPPGIRGNTAQGGTKQVVLETGASVAAPLFINEGDVIKVNTETGEYVERVSKR